ncbi:DNA primase [Streptomyces violascens]|uniref:DNA primase n=1 Tax=Streptomyces violascens TaxID=67381 RepID=UPI0037BC5C52
MNNRLGLGLAVGAGYLLERTKKAKLAFGIGTLVMGKRLQLSPRAIADFAAAQLADNPQFKEIGDQLREDLRGVGKAATGALLNRQIEGIADRLHDRTLDVQDRISGAVPDVPASEEYASEGEDESEDVDGAEAERQADEEGKASAKPSPRSRSGSEGSGRGGSGKEGTSSAKSRPAGRASVKSPSATTSSSNKTAKSVQRTAKRAPAKKTSGRRSGQGGEGRG